jgi:hypothetical protein
VVQLATLLGACSLSWQYLVLYRLLLPLLLLQLLLLQLLLLQLLLLQLLLLQLLLLRLLPLRLLRRGTLLLKLPRQLWCNGRRSVLTPAG